MERAVPRRSALRTATPATLTTAATQRGKTCPSQRNEPTGARTDADDQQIQAATHERGDDQDESSDKPDREWLRQAAPWYYTGEYLVCLWLLACLEGIRVTMHATMHRSIEIAITPPVGMGLDGLDAIAPLRRAFARGPVDVAHVATESFWPRRFGIARQADWPAAPYRARPRASGYYLCADPVHLRIDGDAVVLDAGIGATVSEAEAQALIKILNAHFSQDGWTLVAAAPSEWLLHSDGTLDAKTCAPARVHGRSIENFLPQGPDARILKRFGNEAQMLLHEASVNLDREANGQPPINGVWLWGGGRAGASAPVTDGTWVLSDALYVRGLAAAAGATGAPLPAGPDAIDPGAAAVLIDLAAPYAEPHAWVHWLAETWLEPLCRQRGPMRLHTILQDVTASTWLRAPDLLRILRRGSLASRLANAGIPSDAP